MAEPGTPQQRDRRATSPAMMTAAPALFDALGHLISEIRAEVLVPSDCLEAALRQGRWALVKAGGSAATVVDAPTTTEGAA